MDAAIKHVGAMGASATAVGTAARVTAVNVTAEQTTTTDVDAAMNSRYVRSCRLRLHGRHGRLMRIADAVIRKESVHFPASPNACHKEVLGNAAPAV